MKKFLLVLSTIFICTIAFAHTIEWYVDGSVYDTTTCSSGDNITPPTAPVKYGYHFVCWQSGAPTDYTLLEYIESTGTQYIDTGLVGNKDISIFLDFMPVFGDAQNTVVILGDLTDKNTAITVLLKVHGSGTTGSRTNRFGSEKFELYQGQELRLNNRYIYTLDKYGAKIDDVYIGSYSAMPYFTTANNIYLFGVNTGSNDVFIGGGFRVYSLKIYDNNTLVRDFIPVKRISDNAIGMYDTVTDTFFENAGTGTFIAGPEVDDL